MNNDELPAGAGDEDQLAEAQLAASQQFIIAIARVAHEADRAYCEALGDSSRVPWEEAEDWQRDSAFMGVVAILENPRLTPEESHEGWLEHKRAEGWVQGPTKDPIKKCHPCMVEYTQLPAEQRAKDFIFRAVVLAMSMPDTPVPSAEKGRIVLQ